MSYRATHTDTNGTVTIIGDYWTLADACTACYARHSNEWGAAIGSERFSNPVYQYDRGAFSQWNGVSRLYAASPPGLTSCHYDIAGMHR